MEAIVQQILLVFFMFTAAIHSKSSCPISTCNNIFVQIKYPFRLQTDPSPKTCSNYSFIDLRCDDNGQVAINLPSSGDFYVTSIDYVQQRIYLTDPGNCLLGRLITTNISVRPLDAILYENYTYYTCPKERVRYPLNEIHCLSNSTSATVAVMGLPSEFVERTYGCRTVVTSLVPVSWSYTYSADYVDLQLTWNVSGCKLCEDDGPQESGDSESEIARFFGSPIFIASAAVLAIFSSAACLLRIATSLAARAANDNTTEGDDDTVELPATANAATAPPQAALITPEALPETTGATVENSQVKNFSEVEVVIDGKGNVSCSICLEEYNGKDRVRSLGQCGHYFHVECIDEWLQKNTSCPVCRTSLS